MVEIVGAPLIVDPRGLTIAVVAVVVVGTPTGRYINGDITSPSPYGDQGNCGKEDNHQRCHKKSPFHRKTPFSLCPMYHSSPGGVRDDPAYGIFDSHLVLFVLPFIYLIIPHYGGKVKRIYGVNLRVFRGICP
ncbi:MAG: hypothetical protein AMS15_08450 [Planctomycetes bacterium DG_23]|nr:MAG: hypothetical protein AMS15_08450 [Planctomycetes bacterium DG_23]